MFSYTLLEGAYRKPIKWEDAYWRKWGKCKRSKEIERRLLETGVRGSGRDGSFGIWCVLDGLFHALCKHANARAHSAVLCVAWWSRHLLEGILIISLGSGRPGKFPSFFRSVPLFILNPTLFSLRPFSLLFSLLPPVCLSWYWGGGGG